MTSDPFVSIIYLAIRTLETCQSRDILRKNAHALLKYEDYAALIRKNMPERQDHQSQIEENLSKGIHFYWNPDLHQEVSYETIADMAKKYSVRNFELPRWETSNGFVKTTIP